VDLPCASLPKLHTLRLYNIDPTFESVTDATTHNPLPSLTSLKAYESQYINPYLHMLTSLQQLSLSDMDYPTGNLMKMATALTQLTRLRLEWTGESGTLRSASWPQLWEVHNSSRIGACILAFCSTMQQHTMQHTSRT
jgi:hypothetical protein